MSPANSNSDIQPRVCRFHLGPMGCRRTDCRFSHPPFPESSLPDFGSCSKSPTPPPHDLLEVARSLPSPHSFADLPDPEKAAYYNLALTQLEHFSHSLIRLLEESIRHDDEVASLRGDLCSSQQQINLLNGQLSHASARVLETETEAKQLKRRVETSENQLEAMKDSLRRIEDSQTLLQSTIAKLRDQNTNLEGQIEIATKGWNNETETNRRLQRSLIHLERDFAQREGDLQKHVAALRDCNATLEAALLAETERASRAGLGPRVIPTEASRQSARTTAATKRAQRKLLVRFADSSQSLPPEQMDPRELEKDMTLAADPQVAELSRLALETTNELRVTRVHLDTAKTEWHKLQKSNERLRELNDKFQSDREAALNATVKLTLELKQLKKFISESAHPELLSLLPSSSSQSSQ